MATSTPPPAPFTASTLFRLPRELRDKIYTHVFDLPAYLILSPAHHLLPPFLTTHPTIQAEALEALCATVTFTLSLTAPPSAPTYAAQWESLKGGLAPLRQHIRHLLVTADEAPTPLTADVESYEAAVSEALRADNDTNPLHSPSNSPSDSDDEDPRIVKTGYRATWAHLLPLPSLRSLTIQLEKSHMSNLSTQDFGPILYALRAAHPRLQVSLRISFDRLLYEETEQEFWETLALQTGVDISAHEYKPMGHVDVSELIAPPSEEDRAYVAEYTPDRKMPSLGGLNEVGLLGESVGMRRVLAACYAVKEPALLRVLMEEHYAVYLTAEEARRREREGKGKETR